MGNRNMAARAMTLVALNKVPTSDMVIDGNMNVWTRQHDGTWVSNGQPVLTSERLRRYHGPIKPWYGSAR